MKIRRPGRALFLLLLASSASPAATAVPYLIQDLHQGYSEESFSARAGGLSNGLLHDGVFYFASRDATYGTELWRSDGTPGGTYRLTDVCPGRCDANPSALEVFGGRVYFSATDGVAGYELWRSDGVPGSERQVRDVCPGPCSAHPVGKALEDEILFVIGNSLWRTDGSPQGTVRVKEICAQDCFLGHVQRLGDFVLFGVAGPRRQELWRSDGTPGGTRPLLRLSLGDPSPFPPDPIPADRFAFFWTHDALWRTDGTQSGTIRIKAKSELCSDCNFVDESVVWKGALYSLIGGRLVKSDGTPAGTIALATFYDSFSVLALTPLVDWLLFLEGDDGSIHSVWRTKGTPETTERFLTPPADLSLVQLVAVGDRHALLPVSRGLAQPWELWVTDGTQEGSRRLEETPLNWGWDPGRLLPAGDLVYFASSASGAILRTDGTEAGTFPIRDLRNEPASAGPLAQAVLGDRLVFSARVSSHAAPLFASDGTPAGTLRLSPLADWADDFTRIGDQLFFSTGEMSLSGLGVRRQGLWKTDGTPTQTGTRRISSTVFWPESLSALGDRLLFAADRERPPSTVRSLADLELWRSDGTRGGTALVKDINPFSTDFGSGAPACAGDPSRPGPGVAVGGRLLFAADDGRSGRELWSSDGTAGGTRLVRDINPRTVPAPPPSPSCPNPQRAAIGRGSDPQHLTPFRGGALFTAHDGTTGRELWWTDGTRTGTRPVADLRTGSSDSRPHDLTPFRGAVYFFASTEGNGEGLWRTDGTARGTTLVRDLAIGGLPSWGASLTVAGDRLFFSIYNESTGAELWTSRGTRASTRRVADLRPGAPGSYPQALADAGGVLVFAADDGESGLEPWRSDGTAAGTFPLGDIHPGRGPSSPGPFSPVGDLLLTGADDGEHGRELWAIPLADVR